MTFNLLRSLEILEHTPDVLITMLKHVSTDWSSHNEGEETWNVHDVVGHLIHGEKTDWIPRMKIILSDNTNKTFEPFNRFAQFDESKNFTLAELLEEFKKLRNESIDQLLSAKLSSVDLAKTGIHPVFGQITLSQLLSTWTVHDLNHIAQISRVMAKQYQDEVGPWTPYLKILQI